MTTGDSKRNGAGEALPRDEVLTRLYREQAAAGGEPSPALDARILAAAREAVAVPRRAARPSMPWWRRFILPVSVTAVLVVSATLTLMVHEEQQKLDLPAPAAAPESAPAAAPAPAGVLKEKAESARDFAPDSAPDSARESTRGPAAQDGVAPIRAGRDAPAASALSRGVPPERAKESRAKAAVGGADERLKKPAASPASEAAKSAPPGEALSRQAPAAFPAAPPMAPQSVPAAPAPATVAAPAMPPAGAAQEASGAAVGGATRLRKQRDELEAAPRDMNQAAKPSQAAPAAASPLPEGAVAEPARRIPAERVAPARAKMIEGGDAARPPEAWLAEIRELKRAGREAEWRESLAQFRRRFPDYPLPDDLR